MTVFIRIAAALCFLAVALGAFGAHWLKSIIDRHGMSEVWNKAVFYHFAHAIVLLFLAFFGATNRGACWLFCAGVLLFSGSLYTMALTNIRLRGAMSPLGGLCVIAGWAWIVITPRASRNRSASLQLTRKKIGKQAGLYSAH